MGTKYNIGLDIGSASVGWAVVEANTQKVIKKGGKALWGVRLFDPAITAVDRRLSRGTRRRYDRRRNRIKLLQEEFKESMNQVDSQFFTKLKESKYHQDDELNKTIKLSREEEREIKKYNNNYKTIYHLRKRLMDNPEKEDIRLVYLAIHHILKYRGNFTYGNSNFSVDNLNLVDKLKEVLDTLATLNPQLGIVEEYQELIDLNKLAAILMEQSKNDVKIKSKEELMNIASKNFATEFGKLIVGSKFDINKLLMIENAEKELKISFSNTDFEDKYNDLEDNLGDKIESLNILQELYSTVFLKKLFKGSANTNLSSLMVDNYYKHEQDLKLLKGLFTNNRELYNILFRSNDEVCLYDQYTHNKKSVEEFTTKLKDLISKLFDDNFKADTKYIDEYTINAKNRIANGEFLPRITDLENGKYPFQLNRDELTKIIVNQGKYYPFLLEKTNDNIYKIVKILEFKIPYYVGPLVSDKQSCFAWMERKQEHIKITPYNFDEIVDKEKTTEKFIKRMISHCTYLLDEYALPNNSILYSRFKVMNELKQIRINGQKLTNEQQHQLIDELFLKINGSITNKKFIDYIRLWDDFDMYDSLNVTGYSSDGKFANTMQTYVDFFGNNGIFENTTYNENDAELIIEWITIFDDKDILENKVRRSYPFLSDQQVKNILKKKYSGWGSLSDKLLNTKYYKDKETNVLKSIMDLMSETEENFMQILNNDKYKFQKMIKDSNIIEDNTKINYHLVENLATSPATKKGIYQALKIVEELVNYIGSEPENISIEMAREDAKKERKIDKKQNLIKLYEKGINQIDNYNKLMKELDKTEINSQKLFLYFIQEGKCLYSGKPLNIEDLNSYEIDHIIPRTLIKDDSIDNKALVYRECNQVKAADYVLPKQYRHYGNIAWWTHLKKIELISAKKFHSLIRKEYKEEDIQGFINRQLVETRQITKHVANILGNFYKKSNIIYLKANLSHNYREKYDLFKFRDINDYHHAHDAYLAAVLGEYKEKYMTKEINFDMVKELNNRLRATGNYKNLKYGYVINSLDDIASDIVNDITNNLVDIETGEVLFDIQNFNKIVENTLYRNDILFSRKTEIKTGAFYKQTIYSKGKGNINIKNNMPADKYGGYSNVNTACLCLVKYGKNQKMIGIPIQVAALSKKDITVKKDFIKNHLKLKDNDSFSIIKDCIPFETELIYKNQNVFVKGYSISHKNCELSNAYQLKLSKENMKKWRYALNYILNDKKKFMLDAEKYCDAIIAYLLNQTEKFPLFNKDIIRIKDNLDYEKLEFDEKKKIIVELLKLYHCNSVNANLSMFKLGDRIGRLSGNTINNGILINKSITGIKENRYEF